MTDREAPRSKPAPRPPGSTLRIAVLIYAVLNLVSGTSILVWPSLFWGTIGGADDEALEVIKSVRWGGAILGAFGIGALMVYARPRGQRTFVTSMALQDAGVTAALVFSSLTDELAYLDTWFVVALIGATALSGLYLWWARFKARDLLGVA
jgi:uncharacterized iron-regulated membrane protein